MMPEDPLLTGWLALWQRLGAKGDPQAAYADLVARYAEPHRAYHNLSHIRRCLADFDAARHLAVYPDEVEWALWFHDAVYDPRAADNEAQSAALAHRVARTSDVRRASAKRIYHLVLATRHDVVPSDADQQLLADIDLASLGLPPEQFEANGRRIRQEYAFVPAEVFRPARAAILESFLSRPHVYATDLFRAEYEAQARRNLRRAVSRLREGADP